MSGKYYRDFVLTAFLPVQTNASFMSPPANTSDIVTCHAGQSLGLGFRLGQVQGLGHRQTWLQRAGLCADLSFMFGIWLWVEGMLRGAMARRAVRQEGNECGGGQY